MGTITVGFRFEDGTCECGSFVDYVVPQWLHDVRLISGDREFVFDFLSRASSRAPAPPGPTNQGTIVVDFRENLILSTQRHFTPGFRLPANVAILDFDAGVAGMYGELLSRGKLTGAKVSGGTVVDSEAFEPAGFDLIGKAREYGHRNVTAMDAREGVGAPGRWMFRIDLAPLEVESFRCDDHEGFNARLTELGLEADTFSAGASEAGRVLR